MTILCYHAVDLSWESPLAVTPDAFAEQAWWLARRRTLLDLPEAIRMLDASGRLPRGTAALTFDDGFACLYDYAWPILKRYRLPATVFLVAATLTEEGHPVDWVDDPPPFPLRTLTADQVLEMQDAGVRFESHSYAHLPLTELDERECERDLRRSRDVLESVLRRPVSSLAYPRGLHDERVRRAARKAGFSYGFALPEQSEPPDPFAIPRVGVWRHNGLPAFRLKLAPWYLPARTGGLQRVRQLALRR